MSKLATQPPSPLPILSAIEEMLADMEKAGKVNLEILTQFDRLIDIAQTQEAFWEKKTDVRRSDAFIVFHLWRNSRLILTKAKERFHEAVVRHENPRVVLETLEFLPTLVTTFGMLSGNPMDYGNRLYEQSRLLRSIAARVDMLPDLKQEIADADTRELKRGISKFSETLGSELIEE